MMIKESGSLRRDPDLRGELAFLARGCDFVLPSRFKKRLKFFQQQQQQQQQQVQSKPEKKPGTPPPVPATAATSPTPAPRSPSPPAPTPAPATPPAPPVSVVPVLPVFVPPPPSAINIPRFYYPRGLPAPGPPQNHDAAIAAAETAFADISMACGYPLYWKAALFNAAGGERTGFVSVHSFIATWRNCNYLEQEDFIPLLQDIVDTHPGLTFLKDAPEFHSRYITTVIQRIFYVVNRSWTGRVTMTELRRSNFLQTLALLEEEDDINQITDYFSYEHFYVIYCKGNSVQRENRMSYAEFVWFLISEEDKKNPTSIEYWFRCMDVDGDGVLSMFELEYFYEEQCERMEGMGIEPLPFQDLLCQMLDLVKPETQGHPRGGITLSDLKRSRMAHIFLDTFFNLEKYLDHEQRDPFAVQKDIDSEGPEPSDWDKYASEEYEILVAEETANEQLHDAVAAAAAATAEEEEDEERLDSNVPPPSLDEMGDWQVENAYGAQLRSAGPGKMFARPNNALSSVDVVKQHPYHS
ncbi:hypothetical protein CRUP_002758 [Coryphaenoides rupestris]|nr:hypothetical protein CRUP_002758 [Coryphaenoides rupestris]